MSFFLSIFELIFYLFAVAFSTNRRRYVDSSVLFIFGYLYEWQRFITNVTHTTINVCIHNVCIHRINHLFILTLTPINVTYTYRCHSHISPCHFHSYQYLQMNIILSWQTTVWPFGAHIFFATSFHRNCHWFHPVGMCDLLFLVYVVLLSMYAACAILSFLY